MEHENSRLKIHTSVRPRAAEAPEIGPAPRPGRKPRARPAPGLTAGEKLIRNTAIAGAALLCVLAVRNVDQPWSNTAMNGLRQAMTMRVDWDESIGRLSFVRALVPETALVFLNLSREADLTPPAEGTIEHGWSADQPWLEYAVAPGAPVAAAADGVVTAAAQGMGGDWIVLIDHGGRETVYGYLAEAQARVGQEVAAGSVIGCAASSGEPRLYFELREGGVAADPTGRFR